MKRLKSFNQIYLLSLATMLIIISCKKEERFIEPGLIGNWTVFSFDDYVSLTKLTKTETNTWSQFNNGDNTMIFSNPTFTGGDVSVINVTNGFVGKFIISSGNKIEIKAGPWTERGEPKWGQLFHSIEFAETYELTKDTLVIFYNQKNNSITLIKTDI